MLTNDDMQIIAKIAAECISQAKIMESIDSLSSTQDSICKIVDGVRQLTEKYRFELMANDHFLREVIFAKGLSSKEVYDNWMKEFYRINQDRYQDAIKPLYHGDDSEE